ncbi:MAG TPA: hypothetical protein VJC07_05335 [Candidatus Nanoarchaeia archaeon]|nr:hypothetical protein [Candidatus Nanoarchaeia archaeon]
MPRFRYFKNPDARALHERALNEDRELDAALWMEQHAPSLCFYSIADPQGVRAVEDRIRHLDEQANQQEAAYRKNDLKRRHPIIGGLLGRILYG